MIASVATGPKGYTFIDLGCGKGLPLIVAALFSFKKIVGVEYSEGLCEIARSNVAAFEASDGATGSSIEIRQEDAAITEIPPGPLFVYMFNSFKPPVLRKVLRKLHSHQSDVVVVYLNPLYEHVFADFGRFEKEDCALNDSYVVYRLRN